MIPGDGKERRGLMKTQVLEASIKKASPKDKFVIRKQVACAYCRSTGKDPFPGTWANSLCQICRGRKMNMISYPRREAKLKPCPFCEGAGIHPFSRMSCTSCNGKGWVVIPKRSVPCPVCKGKGREQEKSFECTKCAGKGELVLV